MRRMPLFSLVLAATLAVSPVLSAQPPHSVLANACAGCHGTNGVGAPHMPMLAGLNEEYLRKVMKQYKTGERPSTIMGRLMRAYTDEEIDAMATFFAAQTWISPPQQVEERLVKKGAKVHEAECEICHKNNGRFMDAKIPRLAGQGIPFLTASLLEYREEDRRLMQKYMKKLMERVRSREVKALAHFYASQR